MSHDEWRRGCRDYGWTFLGGAAFFAAWWGVLLAHNINLRGLWLAVAFFLVMSAFFFLSQRGAS